MDSSEATETFTNTTSNHTSELEEDAELKKLNADSEEVDAGEFDSEIEPQDEYDFLVTKVKRFTVLFDLRQEDWTYEVEQKIRQL